MDRPRIEQLATYLTVRLLVAAVALSTVAMADGFLDWNLLDGVLEKVSGLTIAFLSLAAAAAMAISLILNLSLLASALRSAVERLAPEVGLRSEHHDGSGHGSGDGARR